MSDPERFIAENPFYVLEVDPHASRMEIEREGQKLLGMLELAIQGSDTYATPLGLKFRTSDDVRRAMAILREPRTRVVAELWARLSPAAASDDRLKESQTATTNTTSPSLRSLGWGAR